MRAGTALKRIVLALILANVAVSATGATASQLRTFRAISAAYHDETNHVIVYGYTEEDAVGGTGSSGGCIEVQTAVGSDGGCGPGFEVTLDPTGSVGRLVASVQGQLERPITIEATYLSTGVGSNQVPRVVVFKSPGEPTVNAGYGLNRWSGTFVVANVTSGVGSFDASQAPASGFFSALLTAP